MSIYVITGKPRHGKTYNLASRIPVWLDEYVREQNQNDVDSDITKYPLDESFPVGCLYPNFKVNVGVGALKGYPDRIIGDLHSEMDLRNPTKLIFPWYYIQELNFMKRRGRVLMTEGQRYMNSRRWSSLSEETELKLQWHGKDDLDLWVDVQSFARLDKVLRELVEYVAVVEMTFGNPNNRSTIMPKKSRITWIEPEQMEKFLLQSQTINPETGEPYPTTIVPIEQYSFWHRSKYYKIYNTREKPVKITLPMTIPHEVKYCEDDNCEMFGRNKGHPLIHNKHMLDIKPHGRLGTEENKQKSNSNGYSDQGTSGVSVSPAGDLKEGDSGVVYKFGARKRAGYSVLSANA